MRTVSLILCACTIPAGASAQLPSPPDEALAKRAQRVGVRTDETPISLTGELSTALSRGNTETLVIAGDVDFVWAFHELWMLETEARALYNQSEGENTANAWGLFERIDRFLSDRLSVFVGAGIERDLFAEIDLRTSGQLGASYLLLDRREIEEDDVVTDKLKLELGAYLAHEAFELAPNAPPDATLDEEGREIYAARAAAIFTHGFTDRTTAGLGVALIQDFNDTENAVVNVSAFIASAIVDGFALKITLLNHFDNLPAEPELEKNDLLLTAGVVVSL